MRYAIVESSVVTNVIEAESADFMPGMVPAGENCEIGGTFDGVNFALPVRPAMPGPRTLSPAAFRDRFTADEMDAVIALAYGGDAVARRLLFKLQTQTSINLDSAELMAGLDYLVTAGTLTAARVNEVVA